MNIEKVLNEDLVLLLKSTTKDDALCELVSVITENNDNLDAQDLQEKIFYRESLMSTGVGLGLAVPHVRLEGVERQIVAVGLTSDGIADYETVDNEKIRLIVMIIGGKGQHKEHISLLANIVSLFKDNARKEAILSSVTHKDLCSALMGSVQ